MDGDHMNLWHDIEAGENVPNLINVIVEIPKGSQDKYEYDKRFNIMRLDRVLFSPFHYPEAYGFIPQTISSDGDPLDALVLVTNPSYPGILLKARPIGMLRMSDMGRIDDKILCVSADNPRFKRYKDIKDLEEHLLKEIMHFFKVYKELEGKPVRIIGWKNSREAKKVILHSVELHVKKYGSRKLNCD
jgi:inorganic pyrophosphatase